MSIEIRNRHTREIILVVDSADLRNANLYGANLINADLRNADLYGTDLRCMGDMKYICTMQVDTYFIGFTKDTLQIGTKVHTIEAWKLFSEDVTSNIDIPFLGWWSKWKETIFKIIELSGVGQ